MHWQTREDNDHIVGGMKTMMHEVTKLVNLAFESCIKTEAELKPMATKQPPIKAHKEPQNALNGRRHSSEE
jgi:hypothetical protein